ncbi:MAG: GH92 family glycosyl hydrolase [Limisphaerales bacterium]
MNNRLHRMLRNTLGPGALLAATALAGAAVADYAKPLIGTAEHGHVFPGATVPFGMVQLSPDTRDGSTDDAYQDGAAGYHYSDTSILGFSHNHLTGTGIGDLGNVLLMPCVGELKLVAGKEPGQGYRARFSHDQEEARPGYYRVFLPDSKINVELTATARVGLHRYTFPEAADSHVILDLWHGIGRPNRLRPTDSAITLETDRTVSGFRRSAGWGGDKIYFFVMEFSRPWDAAGLASDHQPVEGKEAHGKNLQAHFDFKTKAGDQIVVRVALSTVSVEGARKNLQAEVATWDFDAIAAAARAQWERTLGDIQVQSTDRNFLETFYTAYYHVFLAPTLLSDVDGQVRGPDGEVHQVKGFDYYSEFSLWDTFRAEHPLLTFVQPGRVNDMISTMLAHYIFFGQKSLPVWVESGKENWCMIGNHSIPIIVDAYLKGFRGWDAQQALAEMVATIGGARAQMPEYRANGYIASEHGAEAVSKTLEYAYDDACMARFTKALGQNTMAECFAKRAENWKNVFDPSTGFFRGKTRDGAWVAPFNPNAILTDSYTEANAWQSYFVPHDVPGLIRKLGGDKKFVARLDAVFENKEPIVNFSEDVVGLIGMYAHGNEPCHHYAYLYTYAGQPWKTQARIRQICGALYNNTAAGMCGNDDCGQMSAWYVFSALGFYPADPCGGIYVIGSPLGDQARLALDPKHYPGREFTVIARNNSPQNMYIQSATLNGQPLTRTWLTHKEIVSGGTLVFQMGPAPNRKWGAAPADRPGNY